MAGGLLLVAFAAGANAEEATETAPPAPGDRPTGSLSCGSANRGALASARAMPDEGVGYVVPEPWRVRGARFGTEEMIGLLERSARSVARRYARALLGVADLSREGGGPAVHHRSHQSGRDVDLIYYAIDRAGDPLPPDEHMAVYGADGRATHAESPVPAKGIPERFFDLERNWALIASLATDADVRVERIFVAGRVRQWLLAYARAAGVDETVIARVEVVLSRAGDSSTHDDHMHVRIACSAEDVALGGCRDELARHRRSGRWRSKVVCGAAPAR